MYIFQSDVCIERSNFTSARLLYSLSLKLYPFHIFYLFPTLTHFPFSIKYFSTHFYTTTPFISNVFPVHPIHSFPYNFPFQYFNSTSISNQIIHFLFTQSIHLPFSTRIYLCISFRSIHTILRHCFYNIFLYFVLIFLL